MRDIEPVLDVKKETPSNSCNTCGKCGKQNVQVIMSRASPFGIRRRRKCLECGARWSTMESEPHYAEVMKDPIRKYRRPKYGTGRDTKYRIGDLVSDPIWREK